MRNKCISLDTSDQFSSVFASRKTDIFKADNVNVEPVKLRNLKAQATMLPDSPRNGNHAAAHMARRSIKCGKSFHTSIN